MNLQGLIDNLDIDLTVPMIKSFFLGALVADKPMNFSKAFDELMSESLQKAKFESTLKEYWEELNSNKVKELNSLFAPGLNLEVAKDQLDYFLTAMALAGTTSESCRNEEIIEILEGLEDLVMDMDDLLAEGNLESTEELTEDLINLWQGFLESKR